jgi:hypothetical protein
MYFSNPPRPDNAPQRTNWKTAFAELLANPALSQRDREVIESLQAHWKRSKSLSRGRKSYFYLIKERTEKAAATAAERAAGGQSTMSARLQALNGRIQDRSSWDAGFIESLIQQEASRDLSARQIEILGEIEGRHTDELLAERLAWANGGYGDLERERMRVACDYYRVSGYYSTITSRHATEDDYIPTKDDYDRVVNNKYSQKVIAAHEAAPKYAAGSLVEVRSNAPRSRLRQRNLQTYLRPGVVCVVVSTSEPIISAAKGCKRYKVLPVGSTQTYLVEERDVKIHR